MNAISIVGNLTDAPELRQTNKGMRTIAIIAATVVSFALLAGCGSKADPPAKSPDTSSSPSTPPTTEPAEPQDEKATVAKAATDFYANLATEAEAFFKTYKGAEHDTYAFFDKSFPKTLAAVDLPSFETKKRAYSTVVLGESRTNVMVAEAGETDRTADDFYKIKDPSKIKITGDKAVIPKTAFAPFSELGDLEQTTFNKVDGKWLLDGAQYDEAYFKAMAWPTMDELPLK